MISKQLSKSRGLLVIDTNSWFLLTLIDLMEYEFDDSKSTWNPEAHAPKVDRMSSAFKLELLSDLETSRLLSQD